MRRDPAIHAYLGGRLSHRHRKPCRTETQHAQPAGSLLRVNRPGAKLTSSALRRSERSVFAQAGAGMTMKAWFIASPRERARACRQVYARNYRKAVRSAAAAQARA